MYSYKCRALCLCVLVFIINDVLTTAAANVYSGQRQWQLQAQPQPTEVVELANATTPNERVMWIQHMRQLRKEVKDCVKQKYGSTWTCVKLSGARIFDDIMSADVIRLWPGVRLVRMLHAIRNATSNTSSLFENAVHNFDEALERKDFQHLTIFDRLALRLAHTLHTHLLQINLRELTDAHMRAADQKAEQSKYGTADTLGTARHRRQRYNMMITMMFGVTALGAVLVPMGFQMLSIVSGKALLLAKMALLLASINGLKKVANSGIHYGLYHVPGEHYGYYDRGDAPHHPRHVTSFALAQPITDEVGLR